VLIKLTAARLGSSVQLMISVLIAAAAAAAQPAQGSSAPGIGAALTAPVARTCKADHPDDVVVCGKPGQPYRIDPVVLEANRAATSRLRPSALANSRSASGSPPQASRRLRPLTAAPDNC
jgi:hypothetical protein